MIQQQSFLSYQNFRYLKLASLLVSGAFLVYWAIHSSDGAYGGTWFGYLSGIVSALMVILLAWYGIRRRRPPYAPNRRKTERRKQVDDAEESYPKNRKIERRKQHPLQTWKYGGTLLGWLSAHVYLGAALVVIVSLHTGWRVGWNIHTLSYILLLLVVVSGMYGAHTYLTLPSRITENAGNESLTDILHRISELDELAHTRAVDLPDEVKLLVTQMREKTRIGGTLFQQLSGKQADCPTRLAVMEMVALGKVLVEGDQPKLIRDLYVVLLQKQRLVEQARKDIYLNAHLKFWLYLHTPLSIALLAALFSHVLIILIHS